MAGHRLTRAIAAAVAGSGAVLLAGAISAVAQDPTDPPSGDAERGAELYVAHCQTCHGADGRGSGPWPPIDDAGAASADYQLRTGRMPFSQGPGQQALRKPPAFDEQEITDLVAFVASLGAGPEIPEVRTDDALLPRGFELFVANCAPCHGATAHGGAVGGGAIAPSLEAVDALTVAETIVVGPGQMPRFVFSDEDRNAVVTYVRHLQAAPDPGGFSIGGIGPVPEGFVGWALGMGSLMIVVVLIGREWQERPPRAPQDPPESADR
jgi:ubiquinol-cytochrome c reductase cytochrome c subunit